MDVEELSGVLLKTGGQFVKISSAQAVPRGYYALERFMNSGKNYAKITLARGILNFKC